MSDQMKLLFAKENGREAIQMDEEIFPCKMGGPHEWASYA